MTGLEEYKEAQVTLAPVAKPLTVNVKEILGVTGPTLTRRLDTTQNQLRVLEDVLKKMLSKLTGYKSEPEADRVMKPGVLGRAEDIDWRVSRAIGWASRMEQQL